MRRPAVAFSIVFLLAAVFVWRRFFISDVTVVNRTGQPVDGVVFSTNVGDYRIGRLSPDQSKCLRIRTKGESDLKLCFDPGAGEPVCRRDGYAENGGYHARFTLQPEGKIAFDESI